MNQSAEETINIHMRVSTWHNIREIRAIWRKDKRGEKEDDWNHDELVSGSCTSFLVHPAAIFLAPQIPSVKVGSTPQQAVVSIRLGDVAHLQQ